MNRLALLTRRLCIIALVLFAAHCSARAEDAATTTDASEKDATTIEYNRDIRPILADLCFACHGTDEESRAAGLRLDEREEAIDYGAIVAGNADESEIIARIRHKDPEWIMPPPETRKTVTAEQQALLARWINEGAEYEDHWSFETPVVASVPKANVAWRKNPIDDYVAGKLEEIGLQPAAEADARTLFRRLHLDITGLPPSAQDASRFVEEYAAGGEAVYEEWVDRLMALPTWGEHRGRYWLDAARYGDTHGMHFDNYREMWPYRDWVIKAFNQNQPFDQFTLEQLAGDLLDDPTESQLVATGFQRCNMTTNEGGTIDEENLANYAADRVQTFGWVFLGLTTNCAQCHDHKFDPITAKDYYSLAAFFRNTTQGPKDGNQKDGRGPVLTLPSEDDRPRWDAIPGELAETEKRLREIRAAEKAPAKNWIEQVTLEEIESQIPSENLSLHLPLDEASRNELAIGGQINGTIQSPNELTWKTVGSREGSLTLTDKTPVSLGPLGQLDPHSSFTLTTWLNLPKQGGGGIIAKMDPKKDYRGWDLFREGNRLAVHLIDQWPQKAIKVSSTQSVIKPGQWQHVAVTYDGSGRAGGVKIYIDGKSVPLRVNSDNLKAETGASFHVAAPLQLGSRFNEAAMTGLSVGSLRIFEGTLKPTEVRVMKDSEEIRQLVLRRSAEPDKELEPKQRRVIEDYYLSVKVPEFGTLSGKVAALKSERSAIEARSPITHIQREKMNSQAMANILVRGQYDQVGEPVTAGTPAALHPMNREDPKNRLGLARWVIDRRNPLTARVTVNRFWQEVFGRGLVPTTEDFGVTGMLPANQELLDFLAVDFQTNDWDVKRFFKQIFTSATYRQAAITTDEKLLKDRDNAFLSRGPRFRMDAEMIRDAALANSGLLSKKMFGPGTKPYQPTDIWNIVGLPGGDTRNYKQDDGENLYRRTVYNFWKRMAPPPSLEALNAPSREVCVVRRERTNTPLQALVTLNDPQFVEAARHLAQNTLATASSGDEFVEQAVSRVLGRSPEPTERLVLLDSFAEFLSHYEVRPDDAKQLLTVGESPVDDRFEPKVLAAWTLVCNQIMNLDEALCK
ncbi:MAG: DUF1553 domain-containing protein [Planctomycetota bacterium]